jgi:predicted pyridoxine 5'-phosphate oxidase superfamily flavin-nucleotide-binding protein
VVEGDADLTARLMPADYKARAEQVILFTVTAWDSNCPQHIPQRFESSDVADAIVAKDEQIAALKAELAMLKAGPDRDS